ncbi:Helix-turn-helix domain-containing protein [Rhizobiales bacterium GAS191]|nr:Helix-turn-helix domain-containing protein [Rhizobiales bacterium GAS191]
MTPEQCRAARKLAGISQAELAGLAVVPATLITDFETGVGMPEARDLDEIQSALEWAGVEFIGETGGGAGVRLRKGGN